MTNEKDVWEYVRVDPSALGRNPYLIERPASLPSSPQLPIEERVMGGGGYIVLPLVGTYGLGLEALDKACKADANSVQPTYFLTMSPKITKLIARPLSFREMILDRLEDFNVLHNADGSARVLEERVKLFDDWFTTSMGIVYQAGSSNFKIIPICEELLKIKKDSKKPFITRDYNSYAVSEVDSSKGIYNQHLTKVQIENHEGWRAAVEGDVALLKNYRDAVFSILKERNRGTMPLGAMAFWILKNLQENELRALLVNNLDGSSNANGNINLNNNARFVRKVVPAPAGAGGAKIL